MLKGGGMAMPTTGGFILACTSCKGWLLLLVEALKLPKRASRDWALLGGRLERSRGKAPSSGAAGGG